MNPNDTTSTARIGNTSYLDRPGGRIGYDVTGARTNEGMAHMNTTNGTTVLVRSRKGRMVAGICAGVAGFFGWDVTLVRVVAAVVSVMTGGTGVLAYLVAWVLIPVEGEKTSIAEDLISKSRHGSPG